MCGETKRFHACESSRGLATSKGGKKNGDPIPDVATTKPSESQSLEEVLTWLMTMWTRAKEEKAYTSNFSIDNGKHPPSTPRDLDLEIHKSEVYFCSSRTDLPSVFSNGYTLR